MEKIDQILESLYDRVIEPVEAKEQLLLLSGVIAVKISEMVEPPLTAQEQSFFIAGFCECIKWLLYTDR